MAGFSRGYAARYPFRAAWRNVDNTGLPKDVCTNLVKASSVSLRRIADPADGSWKAGRLTCHKESDEFFSLLNTVLPSLDTWTLFFEKVAMHPLLHNSDMLRRDVPSTSSGKMCARRVDCRCGRDRLPVLDDVMFCPFGSVTLMGKSFLISDSVVESDSRSSMCDDPVSAHASWFEGWAKMLKAVGRERVCLNLQLV